MYSIYSPYFCIIKQNCNSFFCTIEWYLSIGLALHTAGLRLIILQKSVAIDKCIVVLIIIDNNQSERFTQTHICSMLNSFFSLSACLTQNLGKPSVTSLVTRATKARQLCSVSITRAKRVIQRTCAERQILVVTNCVSKTSRVWTSVALLNPSWQRIG